MRLITHLTILAVWGATSLSSVALAQTPTRNVDEPGLNPYQSVVTLFSPNAPGAQCEAVTSPNFCFVSHPQVPAGKRLVITYASARFSGDSQQVYRSVAIQDGRFRAFLPAPSVIGGPNVGNPDYIAAGPISAYVPENQTPLMLIEGINFAFPGIESAIVGYLVSVQ